MEPRVQGQACYLFYPCLLQQQAHLQQAGKGKVEKYMLPLHQVLWLFPRVSPGAWVLPAERTQSGFQNCGPNHRGCAQSGACLALRDVNPQQVATLAAICSSTHAFCRQSGLHWFAGRPLHQADKLQGLGSSEHTLAARASGPQGIVATQQVLHWQSGNA